MRVATLYALLPLVAAGRLFADNAYLKGALESSTIVQLSPASVPRFQDPLETSQPSLPILELRQVLNSIAPAVKRVAIHSTSADSATYVHTTIDPALPAPGIAFPAAYETSSAIATPSTPLPANYLAVSVTTATQPSTLAPIDYHVAAAAPDPAAPADSVIASVSKITTTTTQPTQPVTGDDYVSVQWIETWIGGTSRTWLPHTFTFHFATRSPDPPPGKGQIGMGTIKGEAGHTKTIMIGAAPTQAVDWVKGVAAVAGAGIFGLMV